MKIHIKDKEWELTDDQLELFAEILYELGFYLTDIKFGGLDCSNSESTTIVGNNKCWPAPVDNSPISNVQLNLDTVLDEYPSVYELAKIRNSST